MSHPNLPYEDVGRLREGDAATRDAVAREMAAMIAGNLRGLLEELDEVLAAGSPMGHVPEFWLDPMHKAQHCLERTGSRLRRVRGWLITLRESVMDERVKSLRVLQVLRRVRSRWPSGHSSRAPSSVPADQPVPPAAAPL